MAINVLEKHWNENAWVEIHPITSAQNVITSESTSIETFVTEKVAEAKSESLVDAQEEIGALQDSMRQEIYSQNGLGTSAGATNALTTTLVLKPTSLYEGFPLKLKLHRDIAGEFTINVDGLGALPVYKNRTTRLTSAKQGDILNLIKDGSSFILISGGGGGGELNIFYGTSDPGDVEGVWLRGVYPISNVVMDNDYWFAGTLTNNTDGYPTMHHTIPAALYGDGNILYIYQRSGGFYSLVGNSYTKLADGFGGGFDIRNMVKFGTKLYCATHNYIYSYDIPTNTVATVANLNASGTRFNPTVFLRGDELYWAGGSDSSNGNLGGIYKYNLTTGTQSAVDTSGEIAGTIQVLVMVDDELWKIAGGTTVRIFNFTTNTWRSVTTTGLSVSLGTSQMSVGLLVGRNIYFSDQGASTGLLKFNVDTLVTTNVGEYGYGKSACTGMGVSEGKLFFSGTRTSGRGRLNQLLLDAKSYPAGTVVIDRDSHYNGSFPAELVSPTNRPPGDFNVFRIPIRNVVYHNGTTLLAPPLSYKASSGWVTYR